MTITYEIEGKIAIIDPYHEGIGPGVHYPGCQYVRRNLAAQDPLPLLFVMEERARANPAWNHEPCQGHGRASAETDEVM